MAPTIMVARIALASNEVHQPNTAHISDLEFQRQNISRSTDTPHVVAIDVLPEEHEK